MTEELESAIVRICREDRRYLGFGVLVSDKRILTCAHVVGAALGLDRKQQVQKPTEPVYFDFPFITPGKIQTARVIFWCPVQEERLVTPEQGDDIAGLEIEDLPPPEAKPIQLRPFQAIELEGHPFEAFGIPRRNPHGAWATGVVLKRLPNGWIQFENKDQSGYSISPGFGGSPVWDKRLNTVIGIIVAVDRNQPETRTGFMIPTQMLIKTWSELEISMSEKVPSPVSGREIFISYAWGGDSEEFVNKLDIAFQEKGVIIVRDKRDLGYKGLIKEFMERIGQGKCVLTVISDKYLRSPNCMFELVQVAKNGKFYDRIFPIVLKDAQIYKPVERIKYIQYWEEQIRELDGAMKGISAAFLQGFREEIDQYTEIRNTIAELTGIFKNMNTLTPDIHSESDFGVLFEAVERKLAE